MARAECSTSDEHRGCGAVSARTGRTWAIAPACGAWSNVSRASRRSHATPSTRQRGSNATCSCTVCHAGTGHRARRCRSSFAWTISPALPGISVVHNVLEPGRGCHFGPYLGGHKVRQAVSALHRALPLAYAGECVTGLGRDLARIRGVGPADGQTLVESITAVLNREPAAVAAVRDMLSRCARARRRYSRTS
jgi:hypothetical protein